MVYVLNIDGKPLMPTERLGRVRHLVKEHRAVIVNYHPFTIKLTYKCPDQTQEVLLGVDAGSKHVGLSATTKQKVLFEAQVELRNDIVKKLATRREFRRSRRNRKTRYRKFRFLNRKKTSQWMAPSIRQKRQSHHYWIDRICHILPVKHITVEIGKFDMQKLKAQEQEMPIPQGSDYQNGDQLGFYNVREFVLFRDGHKCSCCKENLTIWFLTYTISSPGRPEGMHRTTWLHYAVRATKSITVVKLCCLKMSSGVRYTVMQHA